MNEDRMNFQDERQETKNGMLLNALADDPGDGEAAMVLNALTDDPERLKREADRLIDALDDPDSGDVDEMGFFPVT